MSREQSLIPKILKAFSSENALPPHYVLSYEIDFCFSEHKLEIRADEKGHTDRYINYEIKTQKAREKELGYKFIGINPNAENYNSSIEISRIRNHIFKSTKKLVEESTKK